MLGTVEPGVVVVGGLATGFVQQITAGRHQIKIRSRLV